MYVIFYLFKQKNKSNFLIYLLACLEPKAPGVCRGKILRYAYDPKSNSCVSFYYSGCGSTQNNFLTYEECRRECIPQSRY